MDILKDFENKLQSRTFIKRANTTFEKIARTDQGIGAIRARKGPCKKLIEEILPISAFLGYFERPGLDLYCQHFTGNQNFDAKVYCEGWWVTKGFLKSEYFIEVTEACSEKDYLKREHLQKNGFCYGGDNIRRKQDGTIESIPESFHSETLIKEHIEYIISRVKAKNAKNYPENTILIVALSPRTLLSHGEWLDILNGLSSSYEVLNKFQGVFLYDSKNQRKMFMQ